MQAGPNTAFTALRKPRWRATRVHGVLSSVTNTVSRLMQSTLAQWERKCGSMFSASFRKIAWLTLCSQQTDEELAEYQKYLDTTPAEPRLGTVDDIAQIVAFLCEEGSRWVTGSVVCANGGKVTT